MAGDAPEPYSSQGQMEWSQSLDILPARSSSRALMHRAFIIRGLAHLNHYNVLLICLALFIYGYNSALLPNPTDIH